MEACSNDCIESYKGRPKRDDVQDGTCCDGLSSNLHAILHSYHYLCTLDSRSSDQTV